MTTESTYSTQQALWNNQHMERGNHGQEGLLLRDIPNLSAITFETLLPEHSVILEIGCANGRDARYWARRGHTVLGVDFSTVALTQMMDLARTQGIERKIFPIHHDISEGRLPESISFTAFYARSSLHITDEALDRLAFEISEVGEHKALIMIEGKNKYDTKMERSVDMGNGLWRDPRENDHVRRLWSAQDMESLAHRNGWEINEILYKADASSFVRLTATNI